MNSEHTQRNGLGVPLCSTYIRRAVRTTALGHTAQITYRWHFARRTTYDGNIVRASWESCRYKWMRRSWALKGSSIQSNGAMVSSALEHDLFHCSFLEFHSFVIHTHPLVSSEAWSTSIVQISFYVLELRIKIKDFFLGFLFAVADKVIGHNSIGQKLERRFKILLDGVHCTLCTRHISTSQFQLYLFSQEKPL